MLLKEYGEQIRGKKMKGIFLGPTNPLVVQQANEIEKHTNYNVRVFYGELGVDTWNKAKWHEEIETNEVLVLTPDIFYMILSRQIIDIQRICVLIFDEAHHGKQCFLNTNSLAELLGLMPDHYLERKQVA